MLQAGDRFQYRSVVDRYHLRPDYPPEIYRMLSSFLPSPGRVLDVGCGPGKLSYPLSEVALCVDAIDLSAEMIDRARADARNDAGIRWIVGDVHTAALGEDYDLIVAGASIHWMDWDRLFPRLATRVSLQQGTVAFLEGDGAVNQPWGHEELEIMKTTQIAINDEPPAWVSQARFPAPIKETIVRHPWFHRQDGLTLTHRTRRSVHDYIEISFSRQSFALDTMSDEAADGYRRALRRVLQRHAVDDTLTYDVGVTLEWGKLQQPA